MSCAHFSSLRNSFQVKFNYLVEYNTMIKHISNDLFQVEVTNIFFSAPALTCDRHTCDSSDTLPVPHSSGYFSSQVSQSGCGTKRCPWHINVPAGQRINITLFDFGTPASAAADSDRCHWYFVLYDSDVRRDVTRCEGSQAARFEHIYTSVSNVLTVELYKFEDGERAPSFVVQYQGK